MDSRRLTEIVRAAGAPFYIEHHASIGSTNEECGRRAREGAAEGLTVAADAQTAGRGRFDRTWVSPAGNLHLSVLLRPATRAAGAPLGLVASLAVADAVEGIGAKGVALKWPNDLTVGEKKLCGILSMGGIDDGGDRFAVVGIGVNVNTKPAGVEAPVVTLAEITGGEVDTTAFAGAVLVGFHRRYRRLEAEGPGAQLAEWETRSGWVGQAVEVAIGAPGGGPGAGRVITGTVAGLGQGGALRVRRVDGAVEEIHAADATLRNQH